MNPLLHNAEISARNARGAESDPRTAAQIAKALGVGEKLIYAVRQRLGGRATRKLPEIVMTDPRTQKEIAKAYGVSETTLIRFKRLRRA